MPAVVETLPALIVAELVRTAPLAPCKAAHRVEVGFSTEHMCWMAEVECGQRPHTFALDIFTEPKVIARYITKTVHPFVYLEA